MSKKNNLKFTILALTAIIGLTLVKQPVKAAFSGFSINSTSARHSFKGLLGAGNIADTSLARIQTATGSGALSLSASQLIPGDLLEIGSENYYVATNSVILDPGIIPLDRPIGATNSASGTQVLMRTYNDLTFTFTTTKAAPNGFLQALIPAASNSATTADNFPDAGGFDAAMSQLICPNSIPGVFDFTSPIASSAAVNDINHGGQLFHAYTCPYTGTGDANTSFASNPFTVTRLLNPAPTSGHEVGKVDISQLTFRIVDQNQVVQETITDQLSFFEPVKMVVEVAPQISFQIDGVPVTTSICGTPADTTSLSREVPFEDISPQFFKNAAQKFTISTNAAHGYAVTSIADDQMGNGSNACPGADALNNQSCIPDVTANGATSTVAGIWNDPITQKGFGFSLQNLTAGFDPTTFNYTQGYRQFSDRSAGEAPVSILRNPSSTNNDEAYVCYRIVPPADTFSGDYESNIMYTITATF